MVKEISMEMMDILAAGYGLVMVILGYFLKETMDDLKNTKKTSQDNKTKIEVMETEYLNKMERLDERLDDKFGMLYTAIDKLTVKIEELNKRM